MDLEIGGIYSQAGPGSSLVVQHFDELFIPGFEEQNKSWLPNDVNRDDLIFRGPWRNLKID